ncbi:MAG TPA: rhomboid family intramembrane serine protease [Candidatus Angelobacter sp.]|nr:rhomboid family intramembrane serine protease [Candidatus Angelobacter sp.]
MPQCLKCGTELAVNEEGIAPVLCDNCAGRATSRARRSLNTGTMRDYPVTTGLIAVNVAVFAAMLVTGGFANPIQWGANFGVLTVSGEYWRLITSEFVHGGFFHIAFNMWCLWSIGALCERLFGRWQTLMIYLLTGVGGSLLSIAWNSERISVGASGAIFGLVGALLAALKFGDLGVTGAQRTQIIRSMVSFSAINFALGFGFLGFGANIDNMCHLGGFVTGLLIGLPLGAFARENKLLQAGTILATILILCAGGYELAQKRDQNGLETRIEIAFARGDYPKAISLLETYTQEKPNDDSGWIELGLVYEKVQQYDKAIASLEKALQVNPGSDEAKAILERLRSRSSADNL